MLLIFIRNPEFGKVKSRLAASIGKEVTLQVYEFLLKHTAGVTRDLTCEKRVYYSDFIEANDIWDDNFFGKMLQQGQDLGIRMLQGFKEGFDDGFENIVIIGSDLFDIQKEDLEKTFLKLRHSDVVIGPAQDGGYYLLGMKKLETQIFRNKNWGHNSVLQETLKDLEGKKIARLEMKNDIDTFEDLLAEPELLEYVRRREQINFEI